MSDNPESAETQALERKRAYHRSYMRKYREKNKEKIDEYQRDWYKKNYTEDEDKRREKLSRRRAKHRKDPRVQMLHRAKHRAKTAGVVFNLDLDDVEMPEVCPVFGESFVVGTGKLEPNSPSLDRIDPSKGYVKGNVWVVSHRANTIKNNATLEELELVVAALRGHLPKEGS